MEVAVLSDTHVRDGVRAALPPAAIAAIERADVVLHAGDVTTTSALAELQSMAKVFHAVLGNNDLELRTVLGQTALVDLEGLRVAIIHDSGPSVGRARRLRAKFPTADVVVFGHSHAPCNEIGLDTQRLFNPGSATQRRAQPERSMGLWTIEAGRLTDAAIVLLGQRGD